MVKSVSNLSRSGLRDWMIQQLSAAFMAIYILGLVAYLIFRPIDDFYSWHSLFTHNPMRIATLIFFFLLIFHAWIGLWTIVTDYLKNSILRLTVLLVIMISLFACLLWAIEILWGL